MTTWKELLALYRARKKDRQGAITRRFKKVESTPERLGALLERYFEKNPTSYRRMEERYALMAWPEIVGDLASRHSTALRIRQDTLIVKVSDPLWMQQLIFLKHGILKRYQQRFPKLGLKDLFFTR